MRFDDLTGQVFGRLTVLEEVGRRHGFVLWRCQCECGNFVDVTSGCLRNGNTKSCGCLNHEMVSGFHKNYIGLMYGVYKIVRDRDINIDSGKTLVCECTVCGKSRNISVKYLHKLSGCQCVRRDRRRASVESSLVGLSFDYLTIIEVIDNIYVLCQCVCGKIVKRRKDSLYASNISSCGCYRDTFRGDKHWGWNGETKEVSCAYCGKLFNICGCRQTMVKWAHCCSKECKGKWFSENWRGDLIYNYAGGRRSLSSSIRGSLEYYNWVHQIFDRDNYTCRCCGVRGYLNVHHLQSLSSLLNKFNIRTYKESLNCEELWDIDNGITLCEKCHTGINSKNNKAFHRVYGTRSATVQDFKEWFLAITPEFSKELSGVN